MIELLIPVFLKIRLLDVIDIVLVAGLLYALYNLVKGTAAIRIFIGIISFYLIWKIVLFLKMELLSEILGSFISVGVIALIIVFQQEIRKFLLLLGTPKFISKNKRKFIFWKSGFSKTDQVYYSEIIKSCENLSNTKTGALIVIANKFNLQEVVESGIHIDSIITSQLIESVFYKNNPLHDGAIIIRNDRIVAASCILPLSNRKNFPVDYGLRHRAGVGVTEQSDAISIIVSEQTGEIAISKEGKLINNVTLEYLQELLQKRRNQL
ncbi:MAG: diadenylate cyclase CdaA [Saprospiraceae bacterium]|nr:diadenylate cyclase CdaA [Saprospiraceae bacterium]